MTTSLALPLRRAALASTVLTLAALGACSPGPALDAFNDGSGPSGAGGAGSTSSGGGSTTTSSGGGSPTTSSAGGGGPGGAGGMGAVCGDGQVDTPNEQCDDGNTASGDGCSDTCGYELSDGCPTVDLVLRATAVTFTGDTTMAQADLSSTCGGGSAGDYIFGVLAGTTGTLMATLEGNFNNGNNKVLWVRDQCPSNLTTTCDSGDPAQLMLPVTAGTTYYIGVDGQAGAEGPFQLTLSIQ